MGKIPNSPLIEAIFELRWGESALSPGQFEFTQEETELFPGLFLQAIKNKGFAFREAVNSQLGLPFLAPKHRFRKQPGKWPCVQIGLGLLTVNQQGNFSLNKIENQPDEYDWDTFKPEIINSLNAFIESFPSGISNLKNPVAHLRYQDGFLLDDTNIENFLTEKINLEVNNSKLFNTPSKISKGANEINISFTYETSVPTGNISVSIFSALLNGKRGVVFDTTVISRLKPEEISIALLSTWLENAHDLQRHAFDSLINI